MLKRIVEFFIPPQKNESSEYIRRQRLITYAIVLTMIFALFYVLVSGVAGYYAGLYIMLGSWLGYFLLLFMMKYNLNIYKAANLFGLIGAISIYGSIYYSGGFESPVLPWIASTPIVLLLIAGKKSGFVWAIISVLVVVVFGLMYSSGYQFPKAYDLSRETYFQLSCHTGLVLMIFFISIVFENLRESALNQVMKQKDKLEIALAELKATQKQLIQAEKMASLGELTAGIAHEIQNPLNFVNNFSEVSNELVDEMNEELDNGDLEEAKAISSDIKQNLEKINHHGKRADSIVKGMLLHSRGTTSQKELTDINALADEYLRLSYHGFRAKDKSFNADFKLNGDPELPKIEVVPQDVGRVLINLINNAFYAVYEKSKQKVEDYKPLVTVTTRTLKNKIEISVEDNGNGIPDQLKEKIFQPFFTTKPTGQGTGLGLSISYDIIQKGHNGDLQVESTNGVGTKFTITLPIN